MARDPLHPYLYVKTIYILPWESMSSTYAYMPMYSLTGYVAMLAVTMYGKDQVVEVVEK